MIVNISSIGGGRLAFPLGSLYHGAKFAVEGLSEAKLLVDPRVGRLFLGGHMEA